LFSLSNVTMISSVESVLPVNLGADSLIIEEAIGISDPPEKPELDIDVYPNPANDLFHIEWSNKATVDRILISNVLGEELREIVAPAGSTLTINTERFAGGVYFLRIEADGEVTVRMLTINK